MTRVILELVCIAVVVGVLTKVILIVGPVLCTAAKWLLASGSI